MTGRGARLIVLTGLALGTMVLSLGVGAVSIPPRRVLDVLLWPSDPSLDQTEVTILWDLRLARVALAALVGSGLAVAGAGYQGLFRNPLADPYVVGASSGAALGAALAIMGKLDWSFATLGPIPLSAFAGSLLAVSLVHAVATLSGMAQTLTLLLAGIAVSSFLNAVVSLLMFVNDESLVAIFGWLMGSFSNRGWPVVWSTAPYIVAGSVGLWLLSRPLDALTFGEETAEGLGLRLARMRGAVVIAASLTTAAAVSAGGIIGFVGLIAPHAARMLVGARHAYLIPASGLLGAVLMLLADDVARTVAAPAELPVGIITAMLGCPFFIYLLKTRSRFLGTQQ